MDKKSKAYCIGGGIASLSAAVYLIEEGHIKGENICIFDEAKRMGGSLDANKTDASQGYSMRGIRMFEEKAFTCTFDLMHRIPSLNTPGKTIREEFIDFNKSNKTYSKSRLIKDGKAIDSRPLTLGIYDRVLLLGLLLRKESSLEDREIKGYFTPAFFTSNFWYEFSTVFAFQPWHSLIEFRRYFIRFIQDFPSIDTLEGVESSPYNQYDSLVLPIMNWLEKQGVTFMVNTKIIDLGFKQEGDKKTVNCIYHEQDGKAGSITVNEHDYVFATLGSIVANSSTGSMTEAPIDTYEEKSAAWTLWENIAKEHPEFGVPSVFNTHRDKSKWVSFTATFRDPLFFDLAKKYVGKKVTAHGGVNIITSNWLISLVLFYKPYFLNQPKDVYLAWGYGLSPEKVGNVVKKKMEECTGEEILTEVMYHLGLESQQEEITKNAICIPCVTPYITSHFLPRKISDRPPVIPRGSKNLAFLGQYCEIPNDVVFTVEYSIRSAQVAVYSLLKINKKPSPIYKGTHHIGVLYNALKTIVR